jgi:putative ATPase
MALLQAVAAAQAVEHVGLPEARLNLAQATIYLARAAKSNSVYTAISAALEDAASADPVPTHLRDASYAGAKNLGHGKGYVYPHDVPGHWTEQDYRPVRYRGNRYYEPSEMGEDTKDWTPGAGPAGPFRRDPSTG